MSPRRAPIFLRSASISSRRANIFRSSGMFIRMNSRNSRSLAKTWASSMWKPAPLCVPLTTPSSRLNRQSGRTRISARLSQLVKGCDLLPSVGRVELRLHPRAQNQQSQPGDYHGCGSSRRDLRRFFFIDCRLDRTELGHFFALVIAEGWVEQANSSCQNKNNPPHDEQALHLPLRITLT